MRKRSSVLRGLRGAGREEESDGQGSFTQLNKARVVDAMISAHYGWLSKERRQSALEQSADLMIAAACCSLCRRIRVDRSNRKGSHQGERGG